MGAILLELPKASMRNRGLVVSAIPCGSAYSGVSVLRPCLYAVTFVDAPGVVKVGHSWQGWGKRRHGYTGVFGGIAARVIFSIHDACPALENLEADAVAHMGLPVYRGSEWFRGGLLRAACVIENVLDAYVMDYTADVAHVS